MQSSGFLSNFSKHMGRRQGSLVSQYSLIQAMQKLSTWNGYWLSEHIQTRRAQEVLLRQQTAGGGHILTETKGETIISQFEIISVWVNMVRYYDSYVTVTNRDTWILTNCKAWFYLYRATLCTSSRYSYYGSSLTKPQNAIEQRDGAG